MYKAWGLYGTPANGFTLKLNECLSSLPFSPPSSFLSPLLPPPCLLDVGVPSEIIHVGVLCGEEPSSVELVCLPSPPLKSCLLLPCFLDRDNCHAGWCLVLHPSTWKVWVVVSITVDFTHPVETLFSFTYCTIGEDIKFTDGVCNLFQKMVYGFSLT